MTRWAARSRSERTRGALSILALGAAVILLGCGGGGGGGSNIPPGAQVCGSPATSQVVVVCGSVITADVTQAPVSGAVVTLLDASGTPIKDAQGNVVSTQTVADGSFLFSAVPASAVLFRVDPPASGYFQNIIRYDDGLGHAGVYSYTNKTKDGTGACLPALGPLGPGDHRIGGPGIQVFPNTTPPPPPFGCPR